MKKSPLLIALLLSVIILVVGFFLPGQQKERPINLPWQVDIIDADHSKIFGLILKQSTLEQAQSLSKKVPVINLIAHDEGEKTVEAYFDDVNISGLKAKMVLTVDLSEAKLDEIFNRGARISSMGSGRRKITLHPDDLRTVKQTPIASITYLPKVNLDKELVKNRFGEPAEKIKETKSDAEHWLYPDKGIDISLSEENKEVIQYVTQNDFENLVLPLKRMQQNPQAGVIKPAE